MAIPPTVSHTVQQTQEWLKELQLNAGLADEAEALSALRAVLHQLRDRLTVDEAVQLAAQLPTLVRGIYYEGWQPRHVPDKAVSTRDEFLDALSARLRPRRLPPEALAQNVFSLLAHHLDPGEISDAIGQLPDDIKGLWPLNARTFKERMR